MMGKSFEQIPLFSPINSMRMFEHVISSSSKIFVFAYKSRYEHVCIMWEEECDKYYSS